MNFSKRYPLTLKVADHFYSIVLHSESAMKYLSEYIASTDEKAGSEAAEVSQEQYEENIKYLRELDPTAKIDPSLNEYQTLAMPLYSLLLKERIIPLHGVSFIVDGGDEVVILTAPSGTGKTTQYLNWQRIDPDSIQIINGDNSLINAATWPLKVFSSPWAGKENFHSKAAGYLNTVICLQQGRTNQILNMNLLEKIEFLFPQILVQGKSREDVQRICSALSLLIESVNIVKFINDGTLRSTEILKDYLYERLEK